MEEINQQKNFIKQVIFMNIVLFVFPALYLLKINIPFISKEGVLDLALTFGSYGVIMFFVLIWNLFTYRENKKLYKKIKN